MTDDPIRARLPKPLYLEVLGASTHLGKTLMANRLRDAFTDMGVPVTLVRIESERVTAVTTDYDVWIPTEHFARAADLPGGVAGVLRPAFLALQPIAEVGGCMIVDWAGGLVGHRASMLAATALGRMLEKRGFETRAFVMTTNHPDRMAEAREVIEVSAKVAPEIPHTLVLNESHGSFDFVEGSMLSKRLSDLLQTQRGKRVLRMEKIHGDSLGHLAPAGMTLGGLLDQEPDLLAEMIGSDEITVTACLSHLAAWHQRTGAEVRAVLPFLEEVPGS